MEKLQELKIHVFGSGRAASEIIWHNNIVFSFQKGRLRIDTETSFDSANDITLTNNGVSFPLKESKIDEIIEFFQDIKKEMRSEEKTNKKKEI